MRRVHPSTVHRREPSQCIQYTLFFLNVLFWLVGVIMIIAGIYVIVELKEFYGEIADLSSQPSLILLLFVGSLIFLITFIGCIGALRQNTTLLGVYMAIIAIMLLFMITAGVLGFLFADKIKVKGTEKVMIAVDYYRDPKRLDLQNAFDRLQIKLECCGVLSYKDWERNLYFNCSSPSYSKCGVPYTCCKKELRFNRQCGYGVRKPGVSSIDLQEKINTEGCVFRAFTWLKENLLLIGGISVGVVILQLLSLFLANYLRNEIKEVSRHF